MSRRQEDDTSTGVIQQPIPEPKKSKENWIMKYIKSVVVVFTLIGFILSGHIYIDNTYAKGLKLKMVEWRLDMKIEGDKQANLRDQIWSIEDACKMDKSSYQCNSDRLRELQSDKEMVDQRMDALIKREVDA